MGHTSSLAIGGKPEEGGRGGREEETNAPEGGGGAQTYAPTGEANNHTDPHDPQMNRPSLQRGSILIDRSYKP